MREIRSGITLRSGWMSQQDQDGFVNFLQPIAALGLRVTEVVSDKQRGLVLAVAKVFSKAKHSFCQMHYLGNAAEPLSKAGSQGVSQKLCSPNNSYTFMTFIVFDVTNYTFIRHVESIYYSEQQQTIANYCK